ncbi:hypothetical protein GQX73_g5814 [Xylaria multiplex]|uniref:Phosphotyrosine protein phosphatase I domain-containing protein n=1 Tax=Xylaria multiplex TaxID=323545 RepID=A0A7C8IS67_9PEZI|nr:hypothetical protein GQX73_g5814 [Xylaria multiplex]
MTTATSAPNGDKISVLFVCLGNICRSTMAEAVFRSIVKDPSSPYYDLIGTVDSCGTGDYHTGDQPDPRTLATLREHNITNYRHEARQLRNSDFKQFDYIFAMDSSNHSEIQRRLKKVGDDKPKVMLFGEFSGTGRKEVIEDPYYIGGALYEKSYEQSQRFSNNFLATVFPDIPKPKK